MRFLILSDIHANVDAFDAVLEAAPRTSWDRVLVLGDLVGYGADPNAVIDRLRGLPDMRIIRGNHDKVGAGLEDADGFNPVARQAIAWTAAALAPDRRAWLAGLPAGPLLVDAFVEICHGSPFDEDLYVFDELDASRAVKASQRPLCLFGHTHVPAAFTIDGRLKSFGPWRGERFELTLDANLQYLVNCGAVGQPRDGDPRAAFGMVDTVEATVSICRVPYDVATAQRKIVAAGLPDLLAHRLALGR